MQPTSGQTYFAFLASGWIGVALPALLGLFARGLRKRLKLAEKTVKTLRSRPAAQVSALGRRMNVRFYLAMNLSVALFAMIFLLTPLVSFLSGSPASGGSGWAQEVRVALAVFLISGICALVLFYAGKKGDLSWLSGSFKDVRGKERHR